MRWFKAMWLPLAILVVGPSILWLVVWPLFGSAAADQAVRGWPVGIACCALLAGWRVVRWCAGTPVAAALGGLTVWLVALAPAAIVLSLVLPGRQLPPSIVEHPVLLGILPMAVAVTAFGACAMLLGWLGGKAAMRWGRSHAT